MGSVRHLSVVVLSFFACCSATLAAGTDSTALSGTASAERDYHIVRFAGPILQEWKDKASECGVELLDYISDFSFIARADRDSRGRLSALPFVASIVDFPAQYKLSDRLPKGPGKARVVIQAFQDEPISALVQSVANAGGTVLAESKGRRNIIRAELPAAAVAALSRVKEISWIEPYVEPKLTNRPARDITTVSSVWQDLGFYGAGQIVAVADTGLDNGQNNTTMSADFRGRIVAAYARARTNDWSDPHGHGTHVCGSVLGNGVLSGANPALHSYSNSFAGMAPEAGLVIQSIGTSSGSLVLPTSLDQLFQQVVNDGAKIHSNSWGAVVAGAYNSDCQNLDEFAWNNKDMLIVFAAGNDGIDTNEDGVVDLDSLNSPGTAKNCITVGATENYVPSRTLKYGQGWPADFPADPIYSDLVTDKPWGMAAFSSRGPTDDSRMKPDICAPGTYVISARSHMSGTSTLWGVYNTHYLYSGGTSMSTPIVAGAAAVLRQYLVDVKNITNPSSALLKAALMNAATDTQPGQYGTAQYIEIPSARPNNVQGWGRLNLMDAIQPATPTNIAYVEGAGLQTGGSRQYTYSVHTNSVPFRATLVWTDYRGSIQAPSTRKRLTNDLDIMITGPNAQLYHGNNGASADRTNNVETVDIDSPIPGTYTITISAYNVSNGPQPYALVVSGGFGDVPLPVSTVADAKSQPIGTLISLTGKIITAGTDVLGNYFYIEEADRTSGIRISYPGGVAPTGRLVTVSGNLATDGWEKRIDATRVTLLSTGTIPEPFGMRNSNVGGLGLGGNLGPENLGLLIKVWGKVKSHGSDHIIIDDGHKSLNVWTGALAKPAIGSYVSVTGVSSSASGAPVVRARFATDIVTHKTGP